MADFVSTDLTVTLESRDRLILGRARMCYAKLDWTSGPTYHVGGIPMPTADRFGMNSVDALVVYDSCGDGFVYKYDKTNHTLKMLVQGYAHGADGSVTMEDYPVTAACGVTTGISVSLTDALGAATTLLGALQELAEDMVPATTTLYVQVWGR